MKSPFLTLLLATAAAAALAGAAPAAAAKRRAGSTSPPSTARSTRAWTSTSSRAAAGARPTRSRPTRRAGAVSTSWPSGTARSCTRSWRRRRTRAPARSPLEAKVGDYYAACMDEPGIEAQGLAPIRAAARPRGRRRLEGRLFRLLGEHEAEALPTLFRFGSAPDMHDSTQTIASVGQGGLGLPDRDDYLKDDAKSKEKREKYVEHVARMLELAGETRRAGEGRGGDGAAGRDRARRAHLNRVEMRDPKNRDNPMTRRRAAEARPRLRVGRATSRPPARRASRA